MTRLEQQLAFAIELDKLKQVLRATQIIGGARHENSAEHSWHIAVLAMTLAEHAAAPVDVARTVAMLLIHDIVEIDAGDTPAYAAHDPARKAESEAAAAVRIFGLLPHDQAAPLRALWDEFETLQTPESRFANALDRLMPLLHNLNNGGGTWRAYDVDRAAVLRRMDPIRTAMPSLWPQVLGWLDEAAANGWVR